MFTIKFGHLNAEGSPMRLTIILKAGNLFKVLKI
jgi:hypothetical protein